MTETQNNTPAAEAQQDMTQANEANVETAATAAAVDEMSEETLDEVAGGKHSHHQSSGLNDFLNGEWAVSNSG